MLDFGAFRGRKVRCAGIGELLFDIYLDEAMLGGAPANFAYHCVQNRLDSVIISSVGNDELGTRARSILARKFLPSLLAPSDKPTGAVNVTLDANGKPTYQFLADTAWDNLPVTHQLLEFAANLDVVCYGTLAQRSPRSHHTIMAFLDAMPEGSVKIFDVNLRGNFYSERIIQACVEGADILKCNGDELPVLCRIAGTEYTDSAYATYLADHDVHCFICTRGDERSTVFLNGEVSDIPTPETNVVDTVGAGDAFTATFISAALRGEPLSSAHRKAVDYSAYVCTQYGGMPEIPAGLAG